MKGLKDKDVQEWNEILHKERRENSMLLYVNSENSDQILSRILELQGRVEYVGNIDFNKE